tara:strand:- start:6027 stop:6281 length:255 start_codon:yes stop_codon:yes gene_type:complete
MKESIYDWRRLPSLKETYINSVFNGLDHNFKIKDASDHYVLLIETFWHLRIDEDLAIDMLVCSSFWKLSELTRVSIELNNASQM